MYPSAFSELIAFQTAVRLMPRASAIWLPETGVIDWDNFSRALRDIGFTGVFSLETNVKTDGLSPDQIREKRLELAATARRLANGK